MEYYLGEIRAFGFGRIPKGWVPCSGQLLGIAQNAALFALLGTYYGGNGTTTFGVPNLNGKVIVGQGNSVSGTYYPIGVTAGTESITLNTSNLPIHNHPVQANGSYDVGSPSTNFFADSNTPTNPATQNKATVNLYAPQGGAVTPLAPAITPTGGNLPHENRVPFTVLNYCISTAGIFPSRN
jgi:microcystin-dependent protein